MFAHPFAVLSFLMQPSPAPAIAPAPKVRNLICCLFVGQNACLLLFKKFTTPPCLPCPACSPPPPPSPKPPRCVHFLLLLMLCVACDQRV